MRILFCNTYLFRKGGAEVSLFELADLFSRRGHTVMFFGMRDPRNEILEGSKYFVDNIDFDDYRPTRLLWGIKAAGRVLYSNQAMRQVSRLLREKRPEVVYVNNIAHHISPSILRVFKEHGLPVLMSVRDYKIVCPNSLLLNRGGLCERCGGRRFYNCLLYRCKRGSMVPSVVACVEAYLHSLKRVYSLVDVFLAPSSFCREKLIQLGLEEERISVVPNFVNVDGLAQGVPVSEPFCAYFGRLSREKGLFELVKAVSGSAHRLMLIGEGALRAGLVAYAQELGAQNVTFVDRLERRELMEVIGGSLFTVFPSLCYETFGRGVLESFAMGKPVVVSRGTAMAELVEDGFDGLLADPREPGDLADKISAMFSSPERARTMGERGRSKVQEHFGPESVYRRLLSVMEDVGGKSSS